MYTLSRRDVAGLSLAGLSTLALPKLGVAQSLCQAGAPLPSRLSIPCASRHNFGLFRQNSAQVGLVGVISVVNPGGPFDVGSLFLYPWLKPAGQALRSSLHAALPYGPSSSQLAACIPNADLPQDEYVCRYLLQLPWRCFIGFTVDTIAPGAPKLRSWSSDVPKLADGSGVAIDWTSANLNTAWFGGSHVIPATDVCKGRGWRELAVAALNDAARAAC